MKLDDLDQILVSEKSVTPSSSFAADVMSRIQTEASPRLQLPFPWIPFVLSILLLAILSALLLRSDPELRGMHHLVSTLSEWIVFPVEPVIRNAIVSAFASLLGTLMVLWFSLRLTDTRR